MLGVPPAPSNRLVFLCRLPRSSARRASSSMPRRSCIPGSASRCGPRSRRARAIEIVHNGNALAALYAMRAAIELGQPERIVLGTDSPAGSGVQPLGILQTVAMLSSLGEIPAETAFCFATGNTARMRALDCGLIEPGRAADFVLMDRAQPPTARRSWRASGSVICPASAW